MHNDSHIFLGKQIKNYLISYANNCEIPTKCDKAFQPDRYNYFLKSKESF